MRSSGKCFFRVTHSSCFPEATSDIPCADKTNLVVRGHPGGAEDMRGRESS